MPIPINPDLPPEFDATPNDARPESHRQWWFRPYIVTYRLEDWERHYATCPESIRQHWESEGRAKWLAAFPGGTRYDVRCLDGGGWDRSTWHGSFATEAEAVACAERLAESLAGQRPIAGDD